MNNSPHYQKRIWTSINTYLQIMDAVKSYQLSQAEKQSSTSVKKVTTECFSLLWDLNLTFINFLLQVFWVLTINCASNRNTGAKNFLHSSWQALCHWPGGHDFGNLSDIIKWNVAIMFDILHFLSVPLRFLQRLDNQCCSAWDHLNLSLWPTHQNNVRFESEFCKTTTTF